MSLEKMLSFHPVSDRMPVPALTTAARHVGLCAAMCTSCADACLAEPMDMTACVRACLDCAEICAATAMLAIRRTGTNAALLRVALEACARICDLCGAECERHDHEHCRLCATMCRECAEDCRAALAEAR